MTAPATRTATADSTSMEPILYPHVAKLQPSAGGMYGLALVSPIQFVLEDRDRVVRVQGQRTARTSRRPGGSPAECLCHLPWGTRMRDQGDRAPPRNPSLNQKRPGSSPVRSGRHPLARGARVRRCSVCPVGSSEAGTLRGERIAADPEDPGEGDRLPRRDGGHERGGAPRLPRSGGCPSGLPHRPSRPAKRQGPWRHGGRRSGTVARQSDGSFPLKGSGLIFIFLSGYYRVLSNDSIPASALIASR